MRFGPYEIRDVGEIEKILDGSGIEYSIEVDKSAIKEGEKTYHRQYQHFNPGFKYHVRSTYFVIDENELLKLGKKLEKFGILAPQSTDDNPNDWPEDDNADLTRGRRKPVSSTPKLLAFIFFLLLIAFFLMYSFF